MRPEVERALRNDDFIDLTTFGRKTGRPHTIECRFMYHNGKVYVSGFPGPRDWMANLRARPEAVIRVKQSASATFRAAARIVTDQKERRPLLVRYMRFWTPINPIEKAVRFAVVNGLTAWVRTPLPVPWPASRIMRGMPLVEFDLVEEVGGTEGGGA